MLVFSEHTSKRLSYILQFIFHELLGSEWELTTETGHFKEYSGPKLNYSGKSFPDAMQVLPCGLLFETGIRPVEPEVFDFENTRAFFKTGASDFPFDVFSACFYLLSRYEEYLPFESDAHGRFEARNSLAYREHFLGQPVVNIWALALGKKIISKFPALSFTSTPFTFIPTIDVDNVYAYSGKGIIRTVGAYVKSLLKLDFRTIAERTRVLTGSRPDPFDGYAAQEMLVKKYKLNLIYFLLFSECSEQDHALSCRNTRYHYLVQYLRSFSGIGLHPSYASDSKAGKISLEKENLGRAAGIPITRSRQHFLKLSFPHTFQNLIECGIQEDYSMGYASQTGFRAGVCSPFFFYDLQKDKASMLRLFPFSVMDVTFSDYQKLSPEQGLEEAGKVLEEIKKVNGFFIPIWHDRSFSESHYPGWGKAFEELIKLAII